MAAVLLYSDVPAAGASDVFGPMCLMLLLGTVHCQIVSTESSRGSSASPFSSSSTSLARRRRCLPHSETFHIRMEVAFGGLMRFPLISSSGPRPRKSRVLKKAEENSSRHRNTEQKSSRQFREAQQSHSNKVSLKLKLKLFHCFVGFMMLKQHRIRVSSLLRTRPMRSPVRKRRW